MKFFYWFFSLIFLFISGCANKRPPSQPIPVCQQQTQINNLEKAGVQVLWVGDELRIILPNARFFMNNTATLQKLAYPMLNEIVSLLNQKNNFGINILAYTPSLDDFTPNTNLAQQQAQAIVDYFQKHSLNVRLIIASAWQGVSDRQKVGTGSFNDDAPNIFSVEIRTRLLQPEDIQ